MLTALSIDHINFCVRDLKRSVEFYCGLFGFEVRQEGNSSHGPYRIVGKNRVHLCIYEKPDLQIGEGINHFGLNISNFGEVVGECKRRGVVHYEYQWEKSRSVYIEDPDGYEIELSEVQGGGL